MGWSVTVGNDPLRWKKSSISWDDSEQCFKLLVKPFPGDHRVDMGVEL
jgi:hypothetical protein